MTQSLNDEQRRHMETLDEMDPAKVCWCGWYQKGNCRGARECPPELSGADKIARWCPSCRGAPDPRKLDEPIRHTAWCEKRTEKQSR